MKAYDLVRFALQMSGNFTEALAADMADAALVQPTPGKGNGGNHALWTMGHLALVEGMVPKVLLGESNPVEDWKPLFDMGTQPTTNASAYPPFSEVAGKYRDLRASTMKILEQVGESGLDRAPKMVPPGFEKEMQTIGQTLLVVAMHNMTHCGQLADARRAAGRKPVRG